MPRRVARSFTTEASRERDASLLGTAYHEAGHAVVSLYLGLPIYEVTIVKQGDANGSVTHPSPLMLDLGWAVGRERRKAARQMILGCYAGLHAERLLACDAPGFHGAADDENAFDLSREYRVTPRHCGFIGDEYHAAYLERLRKESGRLVRALRVPIEKLAKELMRRKTVRHEDVEKVIGAYLPHRWAGR